ncbi:MAG: hypothetical protein VX181_13030, partial [Pseudomonadota bacterium]|nr:hypothetical protein [Pseudomonadota bacterium]
MFLTTAIDDTNIGTIRRSIFFYASLIVAVFYFDLEVDLGNLPGGFESTNGYGVTSAGVSIVAILVQLYSLARLALARPIAIAKLSKAWTEKDSEAFDSDRHDLKSLISQLEQCAKSPYPTVEHLVQFENHLQSLGQQKDKHQSSRERLSNLVSGLERKIDDIERSQSRLEHGFAEILRPKERPTDPERQKIMQASFPKGGESVVDGNTFEGSSAALLQQDFSEIVAEFRLTIRSPDYLGGLKAIQDQAEQEIVENYDDQKELSEQFKNFKQFLEYCRNLDDLPEVQ